MSKEQEGEVATTQKRRKYELLGEAVRIQKRGGEGGVLNSRSEFNRCYIPRLQLVEEDIQKEIEEVESRKIQEVAEELRRQDQEWVRKKTVGRRAQPKTGVGRVTKGVRKGEIIKEGRPSKKRKHALLTRFK